MLARCSGAALVGLEGQEVAVEVDLAPGLPGLQMVGLADAAVQESRERVRAALRNSGLRVPLNRVIVNLAPADLRKEGPSFDLPIALALLMASGQLQPDRLQGVWSAGELGLDGQLRPVRGAMAIALAARRAGARALVLPEANGAEAALVEGLAIWRADNLVALLQLLEDPRQIPAPAPQAATPEASLDLADVQGQLHGRRALEIAAAGEHHLLLVGPPGSGKTMLARRLPGLLPPLERQDTLELSLLYSVAGLLGPGGALPSQRPFRSPHHGCSAAGLMGGGPLPRPGELALAHRGVLFLDELTEFRRDVLNQLREPLDDGEVWICRARQRVRFPCQIALVAATNPCPCGWFGDPERPCRCSTLQRSRYWNRLSGPLLDRIDLQVVVRRLEAHDLGRPFRSRRPAPWPPVESSRVVAQRVAAARGRMARRNPGGVSNARLGGRALARHGGFSEQALDGWQRAMVQRGLSARGAVRVLRVARTIADLEGCATVGTQAVAEALGYRSFDGLAQPEVPG